MRLSILYLITRILFLFNRIYYGEGGVQAYNEEILVEDVMAFDLKFNSAGDHTPGILYLGFLASNYYWPKNIPLPIRGSPVTTGIVSGQLYDSLTNYKFTSEMREHFPMTSLLTSQSVKHGFECCREGPC